MNGSTILACVLAAVLAAAGCAKSETQAAYTTPDTKAKAAAYIDDPTRLSEKELVERAADAFVFGYPLVLMDVTRETMTSESDARRGRAPMNQLTHMRELPDASFTDVVSPSVDTLYSTAWLDLEKEPMIVSVPNAGDRYYVMQILDAWTNVVDSPGTRTTGKDNLEFAIVGPGFDGRIPRGVKRIESPTRFAWLIGRIQVTGKNDLPAVHAIQDQIRMRPLSVHKGEAPPEREQLSKQKPDGASASPPEKVDSMDAQTFFSRLNRLMAKNPPTHKDAPAMARFEAIGVSPGKPFSLDRFPSEVASAIDEGASQGADRLTKGTQKPLGKQKNGWNVLLSTGEYETNYETRAIVARVGLGANLAEDAVYPQAARDAEGNALDGSNRYVLHFEKDAIPPVRAFWSLTAYDQDHRLVENDKDRYSIGDKDKLKTNADGSIIIYLQNESPGRDKESN